MSLRKNLIKNGIASLFQKGVRIAEQLILVPFFISAWGTDYYGEWIVLSIIPTIIGLSDMGFGTAAANTMVLRYAGGDKKGAIDIAKTGLLVAIAMIIVGTLLSGLGFFIFNKFNFFDNLIIEKSDVIISIFILIVARLLGFLHQVFEAYYRACRRAALSINMLGFYDCAKLGLSILVLLNSGGVIEFALANLVSTVLFLVVYIVVANRILPVIKLSKGTIIKKDVSSVFRKGLGFLLTPVWQSVFLQGTTFVVRIVLGPTSVVLFSTVRTVIRIINQIVNLVTNSIVSELQFEIGQKNFKAVNKVFTFSLCFIVLVSTLGSIFLFIFGDNLYELWTNKALVVPAYMWTVFISSIVFNSVWNFTSVIFVASNRPYVMSFAGLVASVLSILLSYLLLNMCGLIGVPISILIMDVTLAFYILPKGCSLLGVNLKLSIPTVFTELKNLIIKSKQRFFGQLR